MTCGDLGYKNTAGKPCGQTVSSVTRQACKFHMPGENGAIHVTGGAASWTMAGRLARMRRKKLPLGSPDDRMGLVERAAGALIACPAEPAVTSWAAELVRTALGADRIAVSVDHEHRLRALEGK